MLSIHVCACCTKGIKMLIALLYENLLKSGTSVSKNTQNMPRQWAVAEDM